MKNVTSALFLPNSDAATIKQANNTSDIKSGLISAKKKLFWFLLNAAIKQIHNVVLDT